MLWSRRCRAAYQCLDHYSGCNRSISIAVGIEYQHTLLGTSMECGLITHAGRERSIVHTGNSNCISLSNVSIEVIQHDYLAYLPLRYIACSFHIYRAAEESKLPGTGDRHATGCDIYRLPDAAVGIPFQAIVSILDFSTDISAALYTHDPTGITRSAAASQ